MTNLEQQRHDEPFIDLLLAQRVFRGAVDQLRDAMALGIERAMLLETDGREWDPVATAAAIVEATRFREDLEADSLDLYTLVQELEDTYSVRISDEQAAQILTVGQAVDFVLAHNGTPDARR